MMETREIPLLACGAMVRALLDGRKCMTRRAHGLKEINADPDAWTIHGVDEVNGHQYASFKYRTRNVIKDCDCPYRVGDVIWWKETHWRRGRWLKDGKTEAGRDRWVFGASGPEVKFDPQPRLPREELGYHKRPSIFMPRILCRMISRIVEVKPPERIADISEEDAWVEGVTVTEGHILIAQLFAEYWPDLPTVGLSQQAFRELWQSLHGPESWERSDWVWPIRFERIEKGI